MKRLLFMFMLMVSSAKAEITYYFSGNLSQPVGTIAAGTPFKGTFSYIYPQSPIGGITIPQLSEYMASYALLGFSLELGPEVINLVNYFFYGVTNIDINNDYGQDSMRFTILNLNSQNQLGGVGVKLGLALIDYSNTVFNDNSLPGDWLRLSNFAPNGISIGSPPPLNTYLSINDIPSELSSLVPEPSALSLLAIGLGGLAMFLRRGRCILPILCLASLCLIEKVNCQTLYETINPNLSHQIVTIQNNAFVPYDYKISIALTSQSDWLVFLNAKARLSDPFGLFKSSDFSRTQNNGIYTYSLLASGTGNNPVRYINLYDAYRYVNWIENGADENADTEDGAYSLIGLDISKGDLAQKNVAAKYYIQNMDEWYGALGVITTPMNYYEWTDSTNYYGFPVYMYAYALYDNGLIGPGAYADVPGRNSHPGGEMSFRIASVPEPSALSLLGIGLGGLAILRRRRS